MINKTIMNPNFAAATQLNPHATVSLSLPKGTKLLAKYVIKNHLDVISGEADIYVCEYNGADYVAKIYNRVDAVKADVIAALKRINSPYVAKIFDVGIYEGRPVTILPYYKLGSLQGKIFSFAELKRNIIPCVNTALKLLHDTGIFHKDLKPANIMQLENGKGVALIDFGISSLKSGNETAIVTNTGITFSYAAPETLPPKFLYLKESDYYSLGVTLYELFCGHLPYANLTPEELERTLTINGLPYPANMPLELRDLITALTYGDISKRKNLKNPNRRWTYDEVEKWLAGKNQSVPGQTVYKNLGGAVYKFNGKNYDDIDSLALALAENWSKGKYDFEHQILSRFFSAHDTEIARLCINAEFERNKNKNSSKTFFNLIYKLSPSMEEFFWKGKFYQSLKEFGQEILSSLRRADMSNQEFWDDVLANNLVSRYLEIHSQEKNFVDAVKSLENTNADRKEDRMKYYRFAYYLIGGAELQIDGKTFSSADELVEYINQLLSVSAENFHAFCLKLMDKNYKLTEEFEAWLIALGNRSNLESWKKFLKAS